MTIADGLRRAAKFGQVCDAVAFATRHRSELGRPVLYDIGGRGGLHKRWVVAHRRGLVQPFLFEPDPAERARLAHIYGDAQVIGVAVGDIEGQASMYLTTEPGCSSLLEPDLPSLQALGLALGREVVARLPVTTKRIDSMIIEGALPSPTYLKIDVQGFEKNVLDGMGDSIDGVIAIELESRLVPHIVERPSSRQCLTGYGAWVSGFLRFAPLDWRTDRSSSATPISLGCHQNSMTARRASSEHSGES